MSDTVSDAVRDFDAEAARESAERLELASLRRHFSDASLRSTNLAGSPMLVAKWATRIEWVKTRRNGLVGIDQYGNAYQIEVDGQTRKFRIPVTLYKVTLVHHLDRWYYVHVAGRRHARHVAGRMYLASLFPEAPAKAGA